MRAWRRIEENEIASIYNSTNTFRGNDLRLDVH